MDANDALELRRLQWRLDAVEPRVRDLEQQVSELVKADQIAAAVAEKVGEQQTLQLTKRQRRWTLLFGAVVAVGSLAGVAALVIQWVT